MGCGGSKDEAVKETDTHGGEIVNENNENEVTAPPRAEGDPNKSDAPHSARRERDDNVEEENVVLPKGNWIKAKGTPYYYCQTENLYYHPPSCQFYDPTNEMWYDSEKNEWYHDNEDDLVAED